jgi:hypothetical protein
MLVNYILDIKMVNLPNLSFSVYRLYSSDFRNCRFFEVLLSMFVALILRSTKETLKQNASNLTGKMSFKCTLLVFFKQNTKTKVK